MFRITLLLSFVLCVAVVTTATPLLLSVHVQEVSDIDGEYASVYKYSSLCPSTISVSGTVIDGVTAVGTTAVAGIKFDSVPCSGGKMSSVGEEIARSKSKLDALGFTDVSARIQSNGPANATVFGGFDRARTLVSWDDSVRKCGANTFDLGTFYFTLQEATGQVITISSPAGSANVVIPDRKKAIFLTGSNELLCILVGDASATIDGGRGPITPDGTPDLTEFTPIANTTAPTTGNNTGEVSIPRETSSKCFPASATVEKIDGSIVLISALQVGDSIRTGADSFSDVFMFTHRESSSINTFVRLTTVTGESITLSAGHYLHVAQYGRLIAAADVKIGDMLLLTSAKGAASAVVRTEIMMARGLYNPQTIDGRIAVDGIVASTYTTAVHPSFAHMSLAPVRWIYERIPHTVSRALTGSLFAAGSPITAAILPSGPSMVTV
jgi:Hint module